MRKSFKNRIKITKKGKILRRRMALGHCRAKKTSQEKQDRRKERRLSYSLKGFRKRII
jgi:ribosomal protein L35